MTKDQTGPRDIGVVETQYLTLDLPPEGFRLASGVCLPELTVAYETYGTLSEAHDNVIFVCHALSGDAHVAGEHAPAGSGKVGWWNKMVGPGKGVDTDHYHVVCANVLGGCSGTTGPASTDPRTERPYGASFPRITVRDMVTAHRLLLRQLKIPRVAALVGGSFGGMQALDWSIAFPDEVDHCVCIASAQRLSAQALSFDVVGRSAITSDPDWQSGDYYGTQRSPRLGLALARKIGHITYLSQEMMDRKFGRERRAATDPADPAELARDEFTSDFQVESYLDYQSRKFVKRFDPNSYLHITRAMDDFDLAGGFDSLEEALAPIRAKVLVVALSADWLFPPEQSVEIANALLRRGKKVSYCRLFAPHGHDAFLVDIEHLSELIRAFLPWVGRYGRTVATGMRNETATIRRDLDLVAGMIEPGARVLDLGCGDGELLDLLAKRRSARGFGVDIEIENVIDAVNRGHNVFLGDIDRDLSMIPDDSYDYAILSETMQVAQRPRQVLHEMLRVARQGIVSFPNFAAWNYRLQLLFSGRMPKGGALPFEWYDTPNIHLFTLNDFADLCQIEGVCVRDTVCIPGGILSHALVKLRLCNWGADRVLVKVGRSTPGEKTRRRRPRRCRWRR